jgi:transcriptional regulator with XRE-family HTH domain
MKRPAVIKKIEQIIEEQGTQKGAAEVLGVSQQYLTDLLRGRRDPGKKILDKLGLESSVVYTVKLESKDGVTA